jgi:hypothetical protein
VNRLLTKSSDLLCAIANSHSHEESVIS